MKPVVANTSAERRVYLNVGHSRNIYHIVTKLITVHFIILYRECDFVSDLKVDDDIILPI